MNRSYTELMKLQTFEERFRYLKLGSRIGDESFGFDRYLNQHFYQSRAWRDIRRNIIIRDNSCDLGVVGFEIFAGLAIHHMNPMTPDDVIHAEDHILDPEYLITVSQRTHNAIHFGDESILRILKPERRPNDTKLW